MSRPVPDPGPDPLPPGSRPPSAVPGPGSPVPHPDDSGRPAAAPTPAPDPRLHALRAAVAARVPVDDREAHAVARFVAELDRLPHPFDQDAGPTHVTASGIVVGPRGTVLHRHKRLGLWLQPGGHLDPGETPAAAVLREVREETGLGLAHPRGGPRLVHVDVHPGGRGHTHLDARYLLHAGDEDLAPGAGESAEAGWFGWDDAIALADPGLRQALVALRSTSGW